MFVVSAIQEKRLDVARSLFFVVMPPDAAQRLLLILGIRLNPIAVAVSLAAVRMRTAERRPIIALIIIFFARSAAFSLCHFWWMWMLLSLYVPIGSSQIINIFFRPFCPLFLRPEAKSKCRLPSKE